MNDERVRRLMHLLSKQIVKEMKRYDETEFADMLSNTTYAILGCLCVHINAIVNGDIENFEGLLDKLCVQAKKQNKEIMGLVKH